MNILYITHHDPRVKTGGNELRSHLLWDGLKQRGRVFTLAITLWQDEKCKYVEDQHPICFVNPQVKGHWLNKLVYRYTNRISGLPILPFTEATDRVITSFFPDQVMDVVVCRYIHSFRYFHVWNDWPVFLDVDDHPKEMFETVVRPSLPYFLRPIGRFVNQLQTQYVMKKIKGGWVSNREQTQLCDDKIKYLPNIPLMPSPSYEVELERGDYLFTIGNMGYSPNFMGVERFLHEIWPFFHEQYPHVGYVIGGGRAPQKLAEKWNTTEGVKYIGYIDKLEIIYAKCLAVVVPVYAGGGTCIKTLEAMAYSRVCLTTPFGVRGLTPEDITPANGLCVFNDALDFTKAYKKLLQEKVRLEMEARGCNYIKTHFTTEAFNSAVNDVLDVKNVTTVL